MAGTKPGHDEKGVTGHDEKGVIFSPLESA